MIIDCLIESHEDSPFGYLIFSKEYELISFNKQIAIYLKNIDHLSVNDICNEAFFLEKLKLCIEKPNSYDNQINKYDYDFIFTPIKEGNQLIAISVHVFKTSKNTFSSQAKANLTPKIEENILNSIEYLPAHVWFMESSGLIYWANKTFKQYTQLTENEFKEGLWINRIHPNDQLKVNRTITIGLKSKQKFSFLFRLKDGNGNYNWFSSIALPQFDNEEKICHWIGINYDINNYQNELLSKKKVERNFEDLLKNKSDQIRKLEREVFHNQKLDTIGNLAGGVAHDFNNLLLIISINAELIKNSPSYLDHKDGIDLILKSTQKGGKLASQLMTFSGKNPNLPIVIDITMVIRSIELLITKSLTDEIKLTIDLADNLSNIFVDPTYLENSLLNIVINARDALNGIPNAEIKIKVENIENTGNIPSFSMNRVKYVKISISDNGQGIQQKFINRIFDPFFTTKEIGKGTGLGLSMVYGFVKKSKGDIFVQSKENEGTTFDIYLPQTSLPLNTKFTEENYFEALLKNDHLNRKILVIEDDPLVRDSVISILESVNYTCYSSFDAYSALLYLQNGLHVDLIFSDVMMPGLLNVLEFHDYIRSIGIQTPILFTSGYADNLLVKNGEIIGYHHLIMKPYDVNELVQKINSILN